MPQNNIQNGTKQNGVKPQEAPEGITKITVGGYKSIAQEQSIEIRPLTILAGANSSGKSSIMQPLLLMKQTLEAPYDPGALRLDGPDVKVTSTSQLFSKTLSNTLGSIFTSGITCAAANPLDYSSACKVQFVQSTMPGISIRQAEYVLGNRQVLIHEGMTQGQIKPILSSSLLKSALSGRLSIARERCFLAVTSHYEPAADENSYAQEGSEEYARSTSYNSWQPAGVIPSFLLGAIHVPGLRGNPERTYPVTAVGERFPGLFQSYVASIISHWQSSNDVDKLARLNGELMRLGLTSVVTAVPINDTQVEILVGRTLRSARQDTVSIADVGIGVSQTLPVLVALLAAKPGQLVYIEQPEIHLHPRAQTAMAQVLADAAMRGVRVVAETHSSLLLLGIQTLVAEGKLPPELVRLHWFTRGDEGATTIQSADLGRDGAFGNWPEDFDDVTLGAQSRYLDAADSYAMRG